MRIISGIYKGRKITGYDIDGTRPTSDRIRESTFAMIQNRVKDSIVLDLFAGSGSLGIEALSNGAKNVYFNDSNHKLIKVLNNNLKSLNINQGNITKLSYKDALLQYKNEHLKFDLIFLDPPYDLIVIENILDLLVSYQLLNNNATIVVEANYYPDVNQNYKLLKQKEYGYKKIMILEYQSS